MATLTNAKHERFAQALADGKSQFEAHGIAGYRAHRSTASTLARDPNISARVSELLRQREDLHKQATVRAIDAAGLTKEAVLEMLLEDRNLARELEQPSAAIRAAELLGKELGMFIDRKEIRTGPLEDASDAHLDGIIREAAAEAEIGLGFAGEGTATKH